MLTADSVSISNLGDVIAGDPEVRQARNIAEAARARLAASVANPEDGLDLADARAMLDALADATLLAADAEDRVLKHYGLLTEAEADKRAAKRRPAPTRPAQPLAPQRAERSAAKPAPQPPWPLQLQEWQPKPGADEKTSAGPAGVGELVPRTWLMVAALATALAFALALAASLTRRS
jgi:hypothetical protein